MTSKWENKDTLFYPTFKVLSNKVLSISQLETTWKFVAILSFWLFWIQLLSSDFCKVVITFYLTYKWKAMGTLFHETLKFG